MAEWLLMKGETKLGELTEIRSNQPFIFCYFEATEDFEPYRQLFEERIRRAESFDSEKDDWSWIEILNQEIDGLGIRLKLIGDSDEVMNPLLHIRGNDAWFRLTEGL